MIYAAISMLSAGHNIDLRFGGRDGADAIQQSTMVEPVDPFERGVLDGFGCLRQRRRRWLTSALYRPLIGSGKSVVVAVADTADGPIIPASARRWVYLIDTYPIANSIVSIGWLGLGPAIR